MAQKEWVSAKEAAKYLSVTKPQIFRLIKEGKISAYLNNDFPIPFYQVDYKSLQKYKTTPKLRGGRPKRESK
jgi:hypothetical protein